ncbi:flagellar biosynthesis repressor FlbT [Sphingomonas changnyeongensis]|uniref:Flagellar biosynthesis repressor FlbT n=1 Tax=Sphingomonas changnyeongensis TaxID=2698679 RepID=A0A7Z2NUZ6_9SPHN|nr:flagellar biosynthesis repressor FlbT [Sphingomonas changnyeongensis]QHL89734.1 flagellar biosynthesis repressor FlbT [Sphingomonas changnyeongensis]
MTLRISLRPGEKVIVNGAVLSAVGRTELAVESKAAILRGREIMSPAEADTPARLLYFHTMMAYIDAESSEAHQDRIIEALRNVSALLRTPEASVATMSFARNVAAMQYYRALGDCRQLMRLEDELLADAQPEQAA